MGFRQVYIKSAKELRLDNENIRIIKQDSEIKLPLSDISTIFLEDPNTMISSRLLSELASFSISMIMCNEKYLPSSQVLPINSSYNSVYVLKLQLGQTSILKNNLWKRIIKQKIYNSKRVIELTNVDANAVNLLEQYYHKVKTGDPDNCEGIAAKIFFKSLYGDDFVRFGSSNISLALNYGYSIIHGCVVRQLISSGLNTYLGIWHNSNKNYYNLASDLMEPFRVIVDYYVYWNIDKLDNPLPFNLRKDLIDLLNKEVMIDSKNYKIEYAIGLVCQSYIACLESNNANLLKLPEIKEVDFLGER